MGTPGIRCRGPDSRRRLREVAAVGMYLEGKTDTMSGQAVYQDRLGRGVKGDPMTLDWPTQKKGLPCVEPGILKMEQVLWPKSHLGSVKSGDTGWGVLRERCRLRSKFENHSSLSGVKETERSVVCK